MHMTSDEPSNYISHLLNIWAGLVSCLIELLGFCLLGNREMELGLTGLSSCVLVVHEVLELVLFDSNPVDMK